MKRTEKRERTVRRDDVVTSLRPSFFSRPFFQTSVVVALSVLLGAGSGCHLFFARDFEHGRYFNGRDATSDWERARMESVDDRSENFEQEQILQAKANESDVARTTRGAVKEVPSDDGALDAPKKNWSSKMRDALRFPFTGKTSRDFELEAELGLSHENRHPEREKNEELTRERREVSSESVHSSDAVSSVASGNGESERHSVSSGFFSKLFSSNHADEFEDELIVGRSVEQSSALNIRQKTVAIPFTSKKASVPKAWNRPEIAVEQYDQGRFIPPMKTIEAYYSVASVAVDRRAIVRIDSYAYGDAATRDVSESFASRRAAALKPSESESADSLSTNSYRSNSYAPPKNDDETGDEPLPDAPTRKSSGYLNRNVGSASLTPIDSTRLNSPSNRIAQTSGLTRAKGFGRTRPISSTAPRSNGVASTSFTERRANLDSSRGFEATPESLLREAEAAPSALEATNARNVGGMSASLGRSSTSRREIDDGFRESLGSRKSYEWFDSEQVVDSDDPYANSPSRDHFPENVSVDQSSRLDRSQDFASFHEDRNSDDLSVLDESRFSASDNRSVNSDREPEQYDGDGEIDLDVIIDDVIANAEYDEPEHGVFSSSTVSGGAIAPDLADAIMEGVKTGETLENKASALSEAAPSSLDARKSDAVSSAPLTREEIAWIEQIKNAIQSLLVEREEHKQRGDDVRICDARLRLLYLVIGEYERSIQEIEDESDPLRVFWEKECRGLETLLQNQLEEIDPTFVAERLRSGLDSFSGLCQLRIRKTLLVEAPACYGLFEERVDPYEPGEPLYAYSELDYVTSRETENGFSIDVECRWRLLDAKGTPLTSFETQRCRNLSETKLRDVVLNVSVPLSEELKSGVYLLEIEVSDLNASKPETCVQRLAVRIAAEDGESASLGANATY